MSRAFVKETAESAPPPERMVAEGPNLVTAEGARADRGPSRAARGGAEIRKQSAVARNAGARSALLVGAAGERAVVRAAQRRCRRVRHRASPSARGRASRRFRIVGEDEADPARGLLNFKSPLAAAILGTAKAT